MFHKFHVLPADAHRRVVGTFDDVNIGQDHAQNSKQRKGRNKTDKACERCRLQRVRCGEKKPCSRCVVMNAECIVSYARTSVPRLLKAGKSPRQFASPPSDNIPSVSSRAEGPAIGDDMSASNTELATTATNLDVNFNEKLVLLEEHVGGAKPTSMQRRPTRKCTTFQMPHQPLPIWHGNTNQNILSDKEQKYHIRTFWDTCNAIMPILSERDLDALLRLGPVNPQNEDPTKTALVSIVVALSMQHTHATGLVGRVLGLHHSYSDQQSASWADTWPGFQHFAHCREIMRTASSFDMNNLRCLVLMVIYFLRGSAFQEAYNLLGITIRKAYIAQLHRAPSQDLDEDEQTERTHLWWLLSTLDVQCSSQLEMPMAIQSDMVRCPCLTEKALAGYLSGSKDNVGSISIASYSVQAIHLGKTIAEIRARPWTVDIQEADQGAIQRHAQAVQCGVQKLDAWHQQVPPGLALYRETKANDDLEQLAYHHDLLSPTWLQRQKVFLEITYRNACVLIQSPFIQLEWAKSSADFEEHLEQSIEKNIIRSHVTGALHNATLIIDLIYTVGSMTDVLFGWPEILQPLWNATTTLMFYIRADVCRPDSSKIWETIIRGQNCFDHLFPFTSPLASMTGSAVRSETMELQASIDSLTTGADLYDLGHHDDSAVPFDEMFSTWSQLEDLPFF